MYSNKNSKVKSKRAQLLSKKKQKKGETTSRVVDLDEQINLISSQQLSSPKIIEVVENQQKKTKSTANESLVDNVETIPVNKFNLFNYSRLTKATPAVIQMNSQVKKSKSTEIQIVVDDKPLNNNTEQAYKSYTFTIEGQKEEIKIKDAFLSDVARKQLNTVPKNIQSIKLEKKVPSEQLMDKQSEKKSRYFQVSHQICFKCNKEGHYAKNCINQDSRRCKICFSRLHDQHSCPQTCYQCGQSGHISNQCPYSKRERCQRCRQRGHSSNYCGVILRDKECINNFETYFSQSDLKKMKCIIEQQHQKSTKKGPHFNCFFYKDWPMPYHELRKSQNRNSHSSKINNQQKSSYRMHHQGYFYRNGQFEARQERRQSSETRQERRQSSNYYNQDHRLQWDRNKFDSKRWRNNQTQHSALFFDEHKKGNNWKWEKRGRNSNRDLYY